MNILCEQQNIVISPEWIPRENIERADYLSRCLDSDDWLVSVNVFSMLSSKWGPYSVDRFASHLNAKCLRFNSRWWVPGCEAVDAMVQWWGKDLNWVVPPPRLAAECINKIIQEKAKCTVVLPYWKSAAYWTCLTDMYGSYKPFITGVLNLHRFNVVEKGSGNNGIFAKNPLLFDMLAFKTF